MVKPQHPFFSGYFFFPRKGVKVDFHGSCPWHRDVNMALNLKRYLGPGSISSRPHQKYDMACIFQICYSLTCRMSTSWKAPACPTEPPNLLESTIRRPSKNTAHSWQRKMACDCSAPKKRFFSPAIAKGVWWVLRDLPNLWRRQIHDLIILIYLAPSNWYFQTIDSMHCHASYQLSSCCREQPPQTRGCRSPGWRHHGIYQAKYSRQISTLTTSKCFKLLCRLYPKGFLHTVNSIYTKFSQTCKV